MGVVRDDRKGGGGEGERGGMRGGGRVAAGGTPAQVLTGANGQRVYQQDVVVLQHPRRGVTLVVVT